MFFSSIYIKVFFFLSTKRYFQGRFFLSIMGAFYLSFSSIIFFSLSCNCTSKTFFSWNSSKGVVSASCPGFVYRQITSHSEWNMKCISRVTNQLFLKAGCCIFYYQSAVSSVWLCLFSYCLFFPFSLVLVCSFLLFSFLAWLRLFFCCWLFLRVWLCLCYFYRWIFL